MSSRVEIPSLPLSCVSALSDMEITDLALPQTILPLQTANFLFKVLRAPSAVVQGASCSLTAIFQVLNCM